MRNRRMVRMVYLFFVAWIASFPQEVDRLILDDRNTFLALVGRYEKTYLLHVSYGKEIDSLLVGPFLRQGSFPLRKSSVVLRDYLVSDDCKCSVVAEIDKIYKTAKVALVIHDGKRIIQEFGGEDGVLVDFNGLPDFDEGQFLVYFTTEFQHSYHQTTEVITVDRRCTPKAEIQFVGAVRDVKARTNNSKAYLDVLLQTYDGIHSDTKGFQAKRFEWDSLHRRFVR